MPRPEPQASAAGTARVGAVPDTREDALLEPREEVARPDHLREASCAGRRPEQL